MDSQRGAQRHRYPVYPAMMARICRNYASDLRAEHAAGMGRMLVVTDAGDASVYVDREEAARRMDLQAERWRIEASGGARNHHDRARMGLW
jgi:hypothetical protein